MIDWQELWVSEHGDDYKLMFNFSRKVLVHKTTNRLVFFFIAPSIYENQDIKKGIMCQLFGGTSKDFTSAGRGKFRLADQLQFSLSVSHQRYIIQYGEFGNR